MNDPLFKSFCVWFFDTPANKYADAIKKEEWKNMNESTIKKINTVWEKLENTREEIYYNIEESIDDSLNLDIYDEIENSLELNVDIGTSQYVLTTTHTKNKLSIVNYCYNLIIETTINSNVFFTHDYFCMSYCLNQYNVYNRTVLRTLYQNTQHKNAIKMKKTMELQIIETVKIPTSEGFIAYYAIVKTYWLCLIQRHWKKLVAQRREVLQKRMMPSQQKLREITGDYSADCRWPSARGILSHYALERSQ